MLKAAVVTLALLSAAPALAVDFSQPIKALDGSPMLKEDKSPLRLEEVVTNSLLSSYPDEQSLPGEEKVRRWSLAIKVHDAPKDPPLTADEVALIKKLVAKAYNPLVVGETWKALDPASVK